jgi:NAD(P)-dependent dehydrogenase (short-subunit alcohol dehydrogenase family)
MAALEPVGPGCQTIQIDDVFPAVVNRWLRQINKMAQAPILPKFTARYHHEPYPAISPLRPELSTAGKSVCITGGAGGIGSAMAKAFTQSGARDLVLIDLNGEGLRRVKDALEHEFGGATNIHTVVLDITNTAAVRDSFSAIETTVGRPLDILVNNAGYQCVGQRVMDIDMVEWFKCFEINVKGSFVTVVEFLRHARPDAIVVNLSSVLAHYGVRRGYCNTHSGYSASKTAITKALDIVQEELPQVRIVNIHPGLILTAMSQKIGNTALSVDSGTSISPPFLTA